MRKLSSRTRHSQRGSGTMMILAVMIVITMVAVVGAWFAGWLASGARARAAADLVAIAAAQAQSEGRSACPVAQEAAAANQAELTACEVTTGWGEFIVDVAVEVELRPQIPGAPQAAHAESRAGIVSDVP